MSKKKELDLFDYIGIFLMIGGTFMTIVTMVLCFRGIFGL